MIKNLFTHTLWALSLFLFANNSIASNYFDKNESCLQVADIMAVENHFTQFQDFTKTDKKEVCRSEVGDKWFEILRSTLAMQRLSLTNKLKEDQDDALTLSPIQEKDWWSYYTHRADSYSIEPSYCNRSKSIVAFVYRFFKGRIHLCPRFFEMSVSEQIEVLMHEVRHFDGHSHVTCTQGNENGSRGACDNDIKNGGSYAVSVQAGVELSQIDQLSDVEQILSESSAIYTINNKFNSLPQVRATDYLFAANKKGEVWKIHTEDHSAPVKVTQLNDPSYVYANGSQFTIYPLNKNKNAYRTFRYFQAQAKSIGQFAMMYNKANPKERSRFGGANYYGLGTIVKANTLNSICGGELAALEFPYGAIKALPILKSSQNEDTLFVLSEAGETYQLNCDAEKQEMALEKTQKDLPSDALDIFAFDSQTAYVLRDNGTLSTFDLLQGRYGQDLNYKNDWVSLTPLKIYNVFDQIQKRK